MNREAIGLHELVLPPIGVWDRQWFLLTAGRNEPGQFNSMTVSWGGLGFLWGRPMAMVVVRPHRYTFEFMERYETFSLCAFAEAHRSTLNLLGTLTGRTTNKMAESGLTPIGLTRIECPGFDEAELILECRKSYFTDLEPGNFRGDWIGGNYPNRDYHRVYLGEIVAAAGVSRFRGQRS